MPISAGLQAEPWPFSKGFEVPSDNPLGDKRLQGEEGVPGNSFSSTYVYLGWATQKEAKTWAADTQEDTQGFKQKMQSNVKPWGFKV